MIEMHLNFNYNTNFLKIKRNENNELPININLLRSLYEIQSPSGKEKKMIDFIKNFIKNLKGVVYKQDKMGNLLITKGALDNDEYYPCLIAHMDEVHNFNNNRIICQAEDFMLAWDVKNGERLGLGADDKNGIYVALEILQRIDKIKVFFSVGEEEGLVGTNTVNLNFFDNVGYMIQCDRRGNSDLITFTNGITVACQRFLHDIEELSEEYDYTEANGTLTDVGGLKTRGVNVSGCNISCGYWSEHTKNELTYLPALENCMNYVYKIIKLLNTGYYPHDYIDYEMSLIKKYNTFSKKKNNFDDFDFFEDPCSKCTGTCYTCKYY